MRDTAIPAILAANLLTLGVAVWQDWSLLMVLWPYWIQSVVIGWYARRRILALTRFSTQGFTMNGRQPPPDDATRRSVATFFLIHFGGFHFAYLVFLLAIGFSEDLVGPFGAGDLALVLLLGIGFAFGHRHSHRRHLAADVAAERNIGTLMFLPYARVLPMHVMVILGVVVGQGLPMLLLFTALKTGADLLMHVVEHRWLQQSRPAAA